MVVDTINDLRGLDGSAGTNVIVLGYNYPGDLGGGEFAWHSGSSANDGGFHFLNNANTGSWSRIVDTGKINVRWFGAYADGSTDTTDEIQAAIDICGMYGLALYFPVGTYLVSSSGASLPCLEIKWNNFSMEGDGYASEIKVKEHTPCSMIILVESATRDTTQIQNVNIRNVRLNGNRAQQSNDYNPLGPYLNYCIVVNVSNVLDIPANITLEGLYCHSAFSGQLVQASGEGGGISLQGTDQASVSPSFPAQNILVNKCFCWDNQGWGIGTNMSSSITITNNFCYDNATMGITLWCSQDALIANNTCYGNSYNGINCEESDRVNITGNNVISTQLSCLTVFNSVDVLVASNVLNHVSSHFENFTLGIASGDGNKRTRESHSVKISGNTLLSNGSEGYVIKIYCGEYPRCYDVNIDNNRIINNGTWKGIEAFCNNLTLSGNDVRGFLFFNSNGGFLIVQDNKLLEDHSLGVNIQVHSCVDFICKNNTLICPTNASSAIFIEPGITGKAQISGTTYKGTYTNFLQYSPPLTPIVYDNTNVT